MTNAPNFNVLVFRTVHKYGEINVYAKDEAAVDAAVLANQRDIVWSVASVDQTVERVTKLD